MTWISTQALSMTAVVLFIILWCNVQRKDRINYESENA